MKLITPSQWLADLVKKSFLKEYPIQVIHNKIDTNIFKPTSSNFREKYGLEDKFIVLGVAGMWSERKGLYDFYKLAQMLDNSYAIVLVGLTQKQIRDLPKKIRGIARLNNQKELASLYSAADVVVNPSVEETYGMTQVEAKACGTPSIVYKGTACEEVAHEIGNIAVDQNPEAIKKALYKMGGAVIICIPKTNNQVDLAKIYTAADIFVNMTYEDNYPTVNLEAEACGTKVLTYDTGGCRETIKKGIVVTRGDIDRIKQNIKIASDCSERSLI